MWLREETPFETNKNLNKLLLTGLKFNGTKQKMWFKGKEEKYISFMQTAATFWRITLTNFAITNGINIHFEYLLQMSTRVYNKYNKRETSKKRISYT